MLLLDRRTQRQIADLTEACARYWELRGIAESDRVEMHVELEQHFIQAALDGKSLDVVVGSNPAAFAESWARELHPLALRGMGVLLPGVIYALGVVSTTALLQQLWTGAPSFTFTPFMAYVLLSCGLLVLLMPLGGFLAPRIESRQRRAMLLVIAVMLGGLVLRATGVRVAWSMALLSWSWPVSLALLAVTVALSCLRSWRRSSQASDPLSRRVSPWRAMMFTAGSVALFDLVLGVGSAAVISVCALAGRVL